MTDQPKVTGLCPVCGRKFVLTSFGRIRAHWARTATGELIRGLPDCYGTGEKPRPTP